MKISIISFKLLGNLHCDNRLETHDNDTDEKWRGNAKTEYLEFSARN